MHDSVSHENSARYLSKIDCVTLKKKLKTSVPLSFIKKLKTKLFKKESNSDSPPPSKTSNNQPKKQDSQPQQRSKPNQSSQNAHRSDRSKSGSNSRNQSRTNSRNNPNRNNQNRPNNNRPHNQRDNRSERPSSPRPPKPQVAPPKPKGKLFSELDLHPDLLKKIAKNKFTNATEVQSRSIPAALAGKNIFCSSETGSGKTLSFLLPMIHKFYTNEIHQALIICPTREIAIQIEKTLKSFEDESLTSALVIGGTNMALQKKALKEYPKILVATPGRLLDMLNSGLIWLNYTGYVVLDEADRMLDMGFEEDLIKIHKELSGDHQTVLFSATLFPEIKKMAKRYADSYEEIIIGNPTSVAGSVEHVLVEMPDNEKFFALKYLISRNPGKMMVFFNTIKDTSGIATQLSRQRIREMNCIHSKIDQPKREKIIEDFRAEHIKVLLASDIAARGIDVPNVELVINYDVPNNSEEYIHRVGRTGRAGKTGIAITFFSAKDKRKLEAIEKLIDAKITRKKSYKDVI